MPYRNETSDWIQRPSSSQGNLQSHPCFQSSLLDDGHAPGSVQEWKKSLSSHRPQLRMTNVDRNAEDYDQNLEVKAYFQSFKHLRRLTISNPNNIQQYEVILLKRAKSYALVGLKGELKSNEAEESEGSRHSPTKKTDKKMDNGEQNDRQIEERLDINTLEAIKNAFIQDSSSSTSSSSSMLKNVHVDASGQMTLHDFTRVLKRYLGPQRGIDEQIENLFNKIDYNAEELISWDELCTFLQLNFDEKSDAEQRDKEVSFIIPAKIHKTPHRYPCSTIALSADHQYLALGSDGTISVWTTNGEPKTTKSIASSAGITQTLTARERLEKRKDEQTRSQPKWITDCQIIAEFNKVVVSTGDRELQFWDQAYCLSTIREVKANELPCTQISSLDSVPIKLNFGIPSADELILLYGDTEGCVNILIFFAAREVFRLLTNVERRKGIPTITLDRFLETFKCDYIRWQVHREWIEGISYDPRLNQIISCSNDSQTAVVIGCIRTSPSAEIQLTENGFSELKSRPIKSADPKSRKHRQTALTEISEEKAASLSSRARTKRDSIVSHQTHSSQDTHSRKVPGNEMRTDSMNMATTAAAGGADGRKNGSVRGQPIIRAAQTRCDVDQTVFKVQKGVRTFDLCIEKNVLVTGGMDRVARIWNPYLPSRPVARLRGHSAPIFLVKIAMEDNRLFSISTDKAVLVWDLIEHTLLACIRPKVHKIRGDLQAVSYNHHTRSLLFASEQITFLNLKLRPYLHADVVVSHYESILGLLFIKEFKQVISCTEHGVVRLWDFLTGRKVHEFQAHQGQAITSMALDTTERRLVTGSRDGSCAIWNVHNGQLLKIFKKPHDSLEITAVAFVVVNNNCSILAVGWDKHVNVFNDDREQIKQVCYPDDRFCKGDDVHHGHRDDILCIDKSQGDLIATGDYGGTIIVSNLSSKKIFATLRYTKQQHQDSHGDEDKENPNDRVVSRVIFIDSRFGRHDSANLISSGPYGEIHFWNIYKNGVLMAKFRPNRERKTIVTQIKLDHTCRLLFAADSLGFLFIYEVERYALHHESSPPHRIRSWRGHVDSVTGLEYIEQAQVIITSSLDWTLRLWNLHGNFIGTFGQSLPWNLYDPATYQHPSVPLDVLTDPRSLPKKIVPNEQDEEEDRDKTTTTTTTTTTTVVPSTVVHKHTVIDDETIANNVHDTLSRVREVQSAGLAGKRLRYFHDKPNVAIRRDGSSHYQHLRCYAIDDNPPTMSTLNNATV
ncbi:hypothetical protein I4U23_027974 [Adineta vaga]|nr:hypothetical protein I4U23_027974 [Adineta vaga]